MWFIPVILVSLSIIYLFFFFSLIVIIIIIILKLFFLNIVCKLYLIVDINIVIYPYC